MASSKRTPTAIEFVEYFRKHPPSTNAKKMLLVHYLSPQKTLTAGSFSKQMGWPPTQRSANLHYGTYAGKVAKQMKYPESSQDVSFLVKFCKPLAGKDKNLWQWIMRKPLATAIKQLGWGTDKRLEDVGSDIGFDPVTQDTKFDGSKRSVAEGRRKLRQHYIRERDPRIIRDAKRLALKKHGELRCEACGFSFAETYGERVSTYIEGHHKISISNMKSGDRTNVRDIALLCSNCHRTIHAKWPYISVDELKRLLRRS